MISLETRCAIYFFPRVCEWGGIVEGWLRGGEVGDSVVCSSEMVWC